MAEIITLKATVKKQRLHEHTVDTQAHFCPECGVNLDEEEIRPPEYACGGCRHLVKLADKFCGECGEALTAGIKVEYYRASNKMTKTEFDIVEANIVARRME